MDRMPRARSGIDLYPGTGRLGGALRTRGGNRARCPRREGTGGRGLDASCHGLTPALSRRLSRWVKARHYSDEAFYQADGAEEPWLGRRREGLERLARRLRGQNPASIAWAESIRDSFSDLRFTDATRVPLAFTRVMRERFNLAAVVAASDGRTSGISTGTGPSMSAGLTG